MDITLNFVLSSRNDQKLGHAGVSGENDLATALHRLSLRRQNYLSEKQFFEEEWERRIHLLADQKEELSSCSTPVESCFSLGSGSELTDFSGVFSNMRALLPEKLQIVKPLEGKNIFLPTIQCIQLFTVGLICLSGLLSVFSESWAWVQMLSTFQSLSRLGWVAVSKVASRFTSTIMQACCVMYHKACNLGACSLDFIHIAD